MAEPAKGVSYIDDSGVGPSENAVSDKLLDDIKVSINNKGQKCFLCNHCPKRFRIKAQCELHISSNHKNYSEDIFRKRSDNRQDDDKHISKAKSKHHCVVCGADFARVSFLRLHWTKSHLKEHGPLEADNPVPDDRSQTDMIQQCQICSVEFKSEAALKKHLDKHAEAGKKKSYPCTMCESNFTSREGRRVHMILKHNAGKTYKCEQCPMIFARMGNLRLHMTTHGIRPHVCSICGQSFARLESLKNHEEACAEGKRGLSCAVCSQRFRKPELLDKHLQQGHPEKDFQCQHCGQEFETARALSHHVRVHDGTFRCEHCLKNFVTEKALRNHEKSRHWDILGIERVIGKQGRRKDAQPRQPKEHVRRNKNRPFLGLEHLAALTDNICEEEKSTETESVNDVKLEDSVEMPDETKTIETDDQTFEDVKVKNDTIEQNCYNIEDDLQLGEDSLKSEIQHVEIQIDEPTFDSSSEEPDDAAHDVEPSVASDHNYSGADLNQTSASDSDDIKRPIVRTKRKSRRKRAPAAPIKNACPKKYKCDDCDKSFAHRTWWGVHRAKAHGIHEDIKPTKANRIHFCDECPKSFCDWRNLVYHLKHIHQKKIDQKRTVSCKSCKKNMLSEKDLELHTCFTLRDRLHRPSEFKCDLCDKAYVSKHGLESHRSVHEEYHKIKCDLCQKPFANDKDLSYHKKRVHVEASFVCEVCGKAFKVQNQLKTHIQIHLKLKGYQCEFCGRGFAQRNGMTAHLRIAHAEQLGEQAMAEREMACPICEKKLKGKVCYRLHMKTHNNDRPFACSYCKKRFIANQDKLRHEQTHTKEYKFKCRFCDKGSTRRKLILLHEAKEHNEFSAEAIGPQHKCTYCGRCFSSPSAVAIHESLHSDALPVGCELCDRRFKNVKYMKYHLKAHHKQSVEMKKTETEASIIQEAKLEGEQVSNSISMDHGKINNCVNTADSVDQPES